ncbi:TadE/TadG family type IV pilus assembly protein [Sphingomonas montana]|uniref:TadE/TadG family type IV pilus assembly protein n=1 Tax=Sphingomonas montana TaxID=1843236 RepID=UPI00096E6BE0|nr:TadE/TadG family type IV pilus assembly protein [Sphingomonas montana]
MFASPRKPSAAPCGRPFLTRLLHDRRGNALAIMAAAMVPLIGLTGSAIDMTRLYVVKVRLQQACDAGVLAGRKFMINDGRPALDTNATNRAKEFFTNNFRTGLFGSSNPTFVPVKTSNQRVGGTASAVVPMTLMRYFTSPDQTLSVTCEAQFDIADIDTVFVLDTTGSMSCAASAAPGCSGDPASYVRSDGSTGYYAQEKYDSKIDALRDSVMLFDTTVREVADRNTQIRYGFVNYASSVNVGKIIPAEYLLSTSWQYQTRRSIGDKNRENNPTPVGFAGGPSAADCVPGRYPKATKWPDGTPRYGYFYSAALLDFSYDLSNTRFSNGLCTGSYVMKAPIWRLQQYDHDISDYVRSLVSVPVLNPTRNDGSTNRWAGCIEEAETRKDATFTYTDLPDDLDPDLKPTADAAKWKPAWPEVVWGRAGQATETYDGPYSPETGRSTPYDDNEVDEDRNRNYGSPNKRFKAYTSCGMPARMLNTMTSAEVSAYVNDNDFRASGGTYHDVGMIWGARLLSRNGIFASKNEVQTGRLPPSRSIVFMTDGDMAPNELVYGLYGLEKLDRRVTSSSDQLLARHNARFRAECDYIKNRMNVTIFVVAFGTALNSDLTYCSSPGLAYKASSTAELKAAFKAIAGKVAMLRISK